MPHDTHSLHILNIVISFIIISFINILILPFLINLGVSGTLNWCLVMRMLLTRNRACFSQILALIEREREPIILTDWITAIELRRITVLSYDMIMLMFNAVQCKNESFTLIWKMNKCKLLTNSTSWIKLILYQIILKEHEYIQIWQTSKNWCIFLTYSHFSVPKIA